MVGWRESHDPMRFITRVDYGRGKSFWVRFQKRMRGGKRETYSRSFADSKHGGKRQALAAAQAWRDQQELTMGISYKGFVKPGYHYFVQCNYRGEPHISCWLRIEEHRNKSCIRSLRVHGSAEAAYRSCAQWLETEMQAMLGRMRAQAKWQPSREAQLVLKRWRRKALSDACQDRRPAVAARSAGAARPQVLLPA